MIKDRLRIFKLQTTRDGKNTLLRSTVGDLILYTTVESMNSKMEKKWFEEPFNMFVEKVSILKLAYEYTKLQKALNCSAKVRICYLTLEPLMNLFDIILPIT